MGTGCCVMLDAAPRKLSVVVRCSIMFYCLAMMTDALSGARYTFFRLYYPRLDDDLTT